VVDGKPEHHPDGVYHLRYAAGGKRVWESVGSDAQLALIAKTKKERLLDAKAAGIALVEETASANTGGIIKGAIAEYLAEVKVQKSWRTHMAYSNALKLFQQSCSKRLMADISRKDLIAYMAYLKGLGNGPRTIANQVTFLSIFLTQFGITGLLTRKDKPRYTQKIVSAYSADEVRQFMAATTREEYELFQFFLCTGCRNQEVQFATWQDVSFDEQTLTVSEKLHLGFSIKDHEEGTIPIPGALVQLLRERRLRYPTTLLIFPAPRTGKNDGHYLKILKRAAFRAGLNCGHCTNKRGQCCATTPTCSRWELHRWRKTYATWHHEAGVSARTIQRWLRHASLSTTLRYLAGSEDKNGRMREIVDSTFALTVR
jgi:integrase/recombinase XerD